MTTMSAQDEYRVEMDRKNYTRAAMIAEEEDLGSEAVEEARKLAFKQTVGEWFNFRGAQVLAHEWEFSAQHIRQLCDELIAEFDEREQREGRSIQVFDIDRMDHTHISKLVSRFRDRF
jgi:hypothetical protein